MPTTTADTIIDRVGRVKHSLQGVGDPRAAQVAVDGLCPTPGCGARVSAVIHSDTASVHCDACGHDFPV